MNCVRCNTHNNYYHEYCYKCGAKLDGAQIPAHASEAEVFPGVLLNKHRLDSNPYRDMKKTRARLIVFAVALAAAAVLIAILALLRV